MSDGLIGVIVSGNNTDEILGRIERSERAGIPAIWMTTRAIRLASRRKLATHRSPPANSAFITFRATSHLRSGSGSR